MAHPRLGSFTALVEEVGDLADEVMKLEIYDEKKETRRRSREQTTKAQLICAGKKYFSTGKADFS